LKHARSPHLLKPASKWPKPEPELIESLAGSLKLRDWEESRPGTKIALCFDVEKVKLGQGGHVPKANEFSYGIDRMLCGLKLTQQENYILCQLYQPTFRWRNSIERPPFWKAWQPCSRIGLP
jgi:hypothetical protein